MGLPMRTLVAWLSMFSFLPAAEISVSLEQPEIRKKAPAFALLDATGRSVALSSFRGKPVLLDLWATKCGGCVKEIPYFVNMHRAYARKGLAVVGVSMEILYEDLKGPAEAWSLVKPFAAAHNVSYPILMGDDGFTKSYSVTTLPVTYLIDKRGRIAATYSGVVDAANLEQNIKALLAER
jgi:peroxiredoxin